MDDWAKLLREAADVFSNSLREAADEIERLKYFERYHDRRMMTPSAFAAKWGEKEG